jgi:hypothetical protein
VRVNVTAHLIVPVLIVPQESAPSTSYVERSICVFCSLWAAESEPGFLSTEMMPLELIPARPFLSCHENAM